MISPPTRLKTQKRKLMRSKKTPKELRNSIKDHFEAISIDYDTYKKHSYYYYNQLQSLLKDLIPDHSQKKIIEVGCATGTLLAGLEPAKGMGIDISENMIRIAKDRWGHISELKFKVGEAEKLEIEECWEVVILSDVIEHLYDPAAAISRFSEVFMPGTILVITWANSIWEPILHFLEMFKLKMPEGEHNWESRKTVIELLRRNCFQIVEEGTRCLIPAKLPFSDFINRFYRQIPLLKRAGLIRFVKAVRTNLTESGRKN